MVSPRERKQIQTEKKEQQVLEGLKKRFYANLHDRIESLCKTHQIKLSEVLSKIGFDQRQFQELGQGRERLSYQQVIILAKA